MEWLMTQIACRLEVLEEKIVRIIEYLNRPTLQNSVERILILYRRRFSEGVFSARLGGLGRLDHQDLATMKSLIFRATRASPFRFR